VNFLYYQKLTNLFCLLHSHIPDISIAPLQVHYYLETFPTTALILCRS